MFDIDDLRDVDRALSNTVETVLLTGAASLHAYASCLDTRPPSYVDWYVRVISNMVTTEWRSELEQLGYTDCTSSVRITNIQIGDAIEGNRCQFTLGVRSPSDRVLDEFVELYFHKNVRISDDWSMIHHSIRTDAVHALSSDKLDMYTRRVMLWKRAQPPEFWREGNLRTAMIVFRDWNARNYDDTRYTPPSVR